MEKIFLFFSKSLSLTIFIMYNNFDPLTLDEDFEYNTNYMDNILLVVCRENYEEFLVHIDIYTKIHISRYSTHLNCFIF